MTRKMNFIIVFLLFVIAQITQAQIPKKLSYNGYLTDASGKALNDENCSLTFSLYSELTGGTPLWSESQTINVKDGIVNVVLGIVNSMELSFDKSYWLGIKLGDGNDLFPKVQLIDCQVKINS